MSSASTGQLASFLSFKSTPEVEVDSLQLQKEQPTSISEKSLSPHAKSESPMMDGIFDTKVNFDSIDKKLDQSKINPDETIQNEIDQVIKETENLEKEAVSKESQNEQQESLRGSSTVKEEVKTPEKLKEPQSIRQQEDTIKSTADDISKVSAYARLEFENFIFYVQTLQVVLGRKSENDQSHSVDVHLGESKAISRKHAKIFYNFGTERFELSIQGKNGAFVDDVFIERGATVPLTNKSKVQIGQIVFRFVLPGMNPQEKLESPSKPINPADAISLRSSLYHHSSSENVGEKSGLSTPGLSSKDFEPVTKVENETSEAAAAQAKKAKEKKQPRPPKPPKKVYTIDEIPEEYRTKPPCSYSNLIATCLRTHGTSKGMSLAEIYKSIKELFPYYKYCPDGWQSSVRHNLSLNKAFRKVSKEGKGWLWGLDEEYCAEKERLKKKQAAAAEAKAKAAALKSEQQQLQQQKLQQQRLEQQKQAEQNALQQQQQQSTISSSLLDNQQGQSLQNLPLQPPPALQQPSLAQNQGIKPNTSQSPLQNQSQLSSTQGTPFMTPQQHTPQTAPSSIPIQQFQQQPVAQVTNARPSVSATPSYTAPQVPSALPTPNTQAPFQQQRAQQGQQQVNQFNSTPQAAKPQLQQPVPLPPSNPSSSIPSQQQSQHIHQSPQPQAAQPVQQFKPSPQLQSPVPQFQNKTPSIQAQLAANRGIPSQQSRPLSHPPPPSPQIHKPPPTGLTADTKKALAHLQQQLVVLSKDLKTLVDRPTISAILTQAIAMTIAQVTQAAKTKGITSDPLATLIDTNPQQLTRILTVALNAATFKVTNGRIKAPLKVSQPPSSAGNSRAGTPNPTQQSPSPRTSSPAVANIPIQPIRKQSPGPQAPVLAPGSIQQHRAPTAQPQQRASPQAQNQRTFTPQPQVSRPQPPPQQQPHAQHSIPSQTPLQSASNSQSPQVQRVSTPLNSNQAQKAAPLPAPSQQQIQRPASQPAYQQPLNQAVVQPQPVKTQSSDLISSNKNLNATSYSQTQPTTPNAPKVQPLQRSASSLSAIQQQPQNLASKLQNASNPSTQVPVAQTSNGQNFTNNGVLAQFQNNNYIQQAQTEPSTPISQKIEPIVPQAETSVDDNRPASQPNVNAMFSGSLSIDDVSRLVTGESSNISANQIQTEAQSSTNNISDTFEHQSIKLEKDLERRSTEQKSGKSTNAGQLGAPNVVVKQEETGYNPNQSHQKNPLHDLSFGKPVVESTPHFKNPSSEAPDLSFLDEDLNDEEFDKVLKSFSKEGTPAIEENDKGMDPDELNKLLSSDFTQGYEAQASKKRSFEEESDISTDNAHTDKASRHE